MKDSDKVIIYVPEDPKAITLEMGIAPGSGLVGRPINEEQVRLYYEGNLYGAENLHEIEGRIISAAGRLHQKYPTVAKTVAQASTLKAVGHVGCTTWAVHVDDKEALDEWSEHYTGAE